MFLSISPDVDNPDAPVEAQKPSISSPSSSKRAKIAEKISPAPAAQSYTIDLPEAPVDEVSNHNNGYY